MSLNTDEPELNGYAWYLYGVLAVFNPLIAVAVNYIIYTEHFNWMMRGNARLLQEGEARIEEAAALPVAHTDLSGYRYMPMTYSKSQGSVNNNSSFRGSGSKDQSSRKHSETRGDDQSTNQTSSF
jgi:hypothetical protein